MTRQQLRRTLDGFYRFLIVDRGMGLITAQGYCRTIRPLLMRYNSLKPTHEQYRQYIFTMRHGGYSYNHILNTILALEHYTSHKRYPLKIGRPKKPKRLIPHTLSEAEVARLIQAAPDLRQQAIVAVLAFSGIRNRELCRLKVSHLDPAMNRLIIIDGKGQKDRFANISSECTKLLLDYLTKYVRSSDAFLFTTVRHERKLDTADVRKIVRLMAVKAKLMRRIYPHLLRHSLATNLLNRGASLLTIREQLGHAFIESTMIYAHPMPARARAEYDYFKPAYL